MKQTIFIIILIASCKIYSQKLENRIGDIHITEESYYFDVERKPKKTQTDKSEYYFNDKGQILETISYGSHHYRDLSKIGDIKQFFYTNDLLNTTKSYSINCYSNDYRVLNSKYDYDDKNNVIRKNTYYDNDSLFMSITYTYKPNKEETHFNESTYYERVYDEENRIIELNQRFEDTKNIRWQYTYKYFDNSTVGIFQTYYNDKNEHSKVEIKTYDNEKRLIQYEEIDYFKTKKEYTYSKKGFLKEIKEFELNSNGQYKLKRLKKFKTNINTKKLKQTCLPKIHYEIIHNE